MHFETLYQEAKWKKKYQQHIERSRQEQIKEMSSMKKINPNSNIILAGKLSEQMMPF